jgi:hypothetical protein
MDFHFAGISGISLPQQQAGNQSKHSNSPLYDAGFSTIYLFKTHTKPNTQIKKR